jgi:hypothetical protein
MRLVKIAVAAASILLSTQSYAATWLRYTAEGNGYNFIRDFDGEDDTNRRVYFAYSFSVDIETGRTDNPYDDETASVSVSPGRLYYDRSGGYVNTSLLINFDSNYNQTGFPRREYIPATGYLTYVCQRCGFSVDGSVERLLVAEATDFEDATISLSQAPVPEPATWAMMTMGFGLIGTSLRRRNTAVAVA